MSQFSDHAPQVDIDSLLLVVVGAHLKAEVADRPLAHSLQNRIGAWQRSAGCEHGQGGLRTLICTDLWYLNDSDLLTRPAIIVGEPAVNAAAAYFANRLPTALVVDETYEVQLDVELIDLHVCLWGVNHEATAAAVEAFAGRYLDAFLRAAHGMAEVG